MTAMTISDNERRDVARKLRAARGPSLMVLMGVLGVGGAHLFDRLADLIEPSCDRDALLALADEMDHPVRQAVWNQTSGVRREHIMVEYARRIREACGEVEPCDEQS